MTSREWVTLNRAKIIPIHVNVKLSGIVILNLFRDVMKTRITLDRIDSDTMRRHYHGSKLITTKQFFPSWN